MSEPPAGEPRVTSSDATPEAVEETPRVSSLRPENRAAKPFSMRRLLNVASIAVVCVALLALAIHWLPDALPKPKPTPNPQTAHAQQTLAAIRALAHGASWKPIGPDWATSIAFSADTSVGYACGSYPGKPFTFIAVYHVTENTWETLSSPLTAPGAVDSCGVSISPVDSADIIVTIGQCRNCTGAHVPISLVYRSYNGGATWNALALPPATLVTDIAWTGQSTLFLAAEDTKNAGTATPPTFTLLVSRKGGPLTEIPAKSLVGADMTFDSISLLSSGAVVYASLYSDSASCTSPCTAFVESDDDGRFWASHPLTWRDHPVEVSAALPGTSTLIASTFDEASNTTIVLRSDAGGVGWQPLPDFPVNPGTGGAVLFVAPNSAIYAFCFGNADAVYALQNGAPTWQTVVALPSGYPVTVQYDAGGNAVALWAEAHAPNGPNTVPGLAYIPLPANAP